MGSGLGTPSAHCCQSQREVFQLPTPTPSSPAPVLSLGSWNGQQGLPRPSDLGGGWEPLVPSRRQAQRQQWRIQTVQDVGPEKANTPTEPLITGPMSMAAELLPGARLASHSRGACDTSRAGRGPQAGRSRLGQEAANGASEQACRQQGQHGQRKQDPHPMPLPCREGQACGQGHRQWWGQQASSLSLGCPPDSAGLPQTPPPPTPHPRFLQRLHQGIQAGLVLGFAPVEQGETRAAGQVMGN